MKFFKNNAYTWSGPRAGWVKLEQELQPLTRILDSEPILAQSLALPGCFLAGGMFKDFFRGKPPKDLDFFFETEESFRKAEQLFTQDSGWSLVYGNANCLGFEKAYSFSDNEPPRVELIRRRFSSFSETIENFDLTIAQCGARYRAGKLVVEAKEGFPRVLEEKILEFTLAGLASEAPLERLVRYHTYGFTAMPSTVAQALAIECASEQCQGPLPIVPLERIVNEGKIYLGDSLNNEPVSFAPAHKPTSRALHEVAHFVHSFGSFQAYEDSVKVYVEQQLEAFAPGSSIFLKNGSRSQFVRLVRLLEEAKSWDMLPRHLFLALLFSDSLVKGSSSLRQRDAGVIFLRGVSSWSSEEVKSFLEDYYKHSQPLLTFAEWEEFLKSELFFPSELLCYTMTAFHDSAVNPQQWRPASKEHARSAVLTRLMTAATPPPF